MGRRSSQKECPGVYHSGFNVEATPGYNWKRERKARYQPAPGGLNVDVHGVLFALVAVVFVVYPLAQWALGQ